MGARRNSGDPGIKKHPAKAITDDLIDRAISKLPEVAPPSHGDKTDGVSITDAAVIKGLWTRTDNLTEATLRKEAEAGRDPIAALKEAHQRQMRIAVEVRREQMAREKAERDAAYYATLGWMAENPTVTPDAVPEAGTDGNYISDKSGKFSTADAALSGADRPTDCRMPPPEVPENQQVNFEVDENSDPPKLQAALASIAEDIPVLALWGVADGLCDCPKGSECKSPGKHPYPRFSPNGVHSATLDAAKVRMWFAKDPRINFGQAMGGDLNLISIDIDPRNEGDVSYHDLLQHYGEDAFPETREKPTGGGGWHKLYRLSKPISGNGDLKAKLAPGIDVKGTGGYVVAAHGDHVSGMPYGPYTEQEIALAPAWIEERIMKAIEDARAPEPIRFQADKGRTCGTAAGGRTFGVGERNDRLRDVACGRWLNADKYGIRSETDLYQQLLEVRDTRCAPGTGKDAPPTDAELFDLVRRTARKFPIGSGQGVAA